MYHKTKANVLEAMGEQSKAIDAYRFADQTYLKNNPQAKEERATVLTQLANAELNNVSHECSFLCCSIVKLLFFVLS